MSDDKKGFDSVMFDDIGDDKIKETYLALLIFLILESLAMIYVFYNVILFVGNKYLRFSIGGDNDSYLENIVKKCYTSLSYTFWIGFITSLIVCLYARFNEIKISDSEFVKSDLELNKTKLLIIMAFSVVSLIFNIVFAIMSTLPYNNSRNPKLPKDYPIRFLLKVFAGLIFISGSHYISGWILIVEGKIRGEKKEEITTTSTN